MHRHREPEEGDLEDGLRLEEDDLGQNYHWCESEGMKADILTKLSSAASRARWMDEANSIVLKSVKKSDVARARMLPSRPRASVDRTLARRIVAEQTAVA